MKIKCFTLYDTSNLLIYKLRQKTIKLYTIWIASKSVNKCIYKTKKNKNMTILTCAKLHSILLIMHEISLQQNASKICTNYKTL